MLWGADRDVGGLLVTHVLWQAERLFAGSRIELIWFPVTRLCCPFVNGKALRSGRMKLNMDVCDIKRLAYNR